MYNKFKTFAMCKHMIHKIKRFIWTRNLPVIFGNNNHNRNETTLFFPLSHCLLLLPPRGKARHSTSPWSVWNYRKFSIYLSPSCVYVYMYMIVYMHFVYIVRVCMCVCVYVCCMLLSVYNTFTIITIRCSSMTIHLNSRMYTFIFIIFIYIIRKKV